MAEALTLSKPRRNWADILPDEAVTYRQSPWGLWSGVQLIHMAHRVPEFESVSNFHAVFLYQGEPGSMKVRGDGRTRKLEMTPNDFSFVPAFARYESEPGNLVMENIGLLVDPAWLEGQADSAGLGFPSAQLRPALGESSTRIAEIMKLLNDDLRSGLPYGRVFGEGLVSVLAQTLFGRLAPASSPDPSGPLTPRQIQHVSSYIRDNLAADLRLKDLASLAGYSEFHFHRLFRQSTGLRLHEYIVQLRLEKAESLLRTSGLSVGEIAAECGFSDSGHLGRHLRRHRGMSPGELRAHSRR